MQLINSLSINHKLLFGKLSLNLLQEELAVLNLLQSEGSQIEHFWHKLWGEANIYDDLPFSCKEIMPSIINKVQKYIENNPTATLRLPPYLMGLPKYSWTKNYFILKHFQKTVSVLNKNNIDFVVLKGICEIIEGTENEIFRTTRDIDMLIHDYDFPKIRNILESLGWRIPEKQNIFKYFSMPLFGHAETFFSHDLAFSLDIHFSLFHGSAEIGADKFTERVWKDKKPSQRFNNIFVPSIEHRLIIALENACQLGNWRNGLFFKYIIDFQSLASSMNQNEIKNVHNEIKFIPSLKNNFNSFLNELHNQKKEVALNLQTEYTLKVELNSVIILLIIYGEILLNLLKLIFRPVKTFHVIIFLAYKLFTIFLFRIPKHTYLVLFNNSKLNFEGINYHPKIFLSFLPTRNII